MNCTNDVLDI